VAWPAHGLEIATALSTGLASLLIERVASAAAFINARQAARGWY
jgi:hypothetical protein